MAIGELLAFLCLELDDLLMRNDKSSLMMIYGLMILLRAALTAIAINSKRTTMVFSITGENVKS
jgi:hypothetical protein